MNAPTSPIPRFPRHWMPVCLLGLVLAGAVHLALSSSVFLEDLSTQPQPMTEVFPQWLDRKGDRLYRSGRDTPFTGWMVERHPNGSLKSRSRVVRGRLEGPSQGWYPDGGLQVRESFHQGLSQGWRVKWHPNGRVDSVVRIHQGILMGWFRRWHDNGTLAQEIPMVAGEPSGRSRAWHPDGSLKAEVLLQSGKVEAQQFWNPGEQFVPAPHPSFSQFQRP